MCNNSTSWRQQNLAQYTQLRTSSIFLEYHEYKLHIVHCIYLRSSRQGTGDRDHYDAVVRQPCVLASSAVVAALVRSIENYSK